MTDPTHHARAVADSLVHHAAAAQRTGASGADIVPGFRLAADRVAAWQQHGDWRHLINGSASGG